MNVCWNTSIMEACYEAYGVMANNRVKYELTGE